MTDPKTLEERAEALAWKIHDHYCDPKCREYSEKHKEPTPLLAGVRAFAREVAREKFIEGANAFRPTHPSDILYGLTEADIRTEALRRWPR